MRNELLNGNLPLPGKKLFEESEYSEILDVIESMWYSLWHNFCANRKGTSAIHWIEEAGKGRNAKLLLGAINILNSSGWVTVLTTDNFSKITLNEAKLLEFVTKEELDTLVFSIRFHKYLPTADNSKQAGYARVRANGKPTGKKLYRPGMEKGAKSEFTFDKAVLLKHLTEVTEEANKGMLKVHAQYPQLAEDMANYGIVVEEIIKYLASTSLVCNMGINHVDSRGRAIKSGLSKVMNPIGFKVARALLVIPENKRKVATDAGMDAILLFVAELNGYKSGNIKDKLAFGEQCWVENNLPHELHEAMWCERLYKDLYLYEVSKIEGTKHYWTTPIELDAGASVLQYIGVLLGDKQLIEATNLDSKGDLVDPWGLIPSVSRKQTKPCIMRQVYGSSQSSSVILDDQGVDYNGVDILALEEGLNTGAYGTANALKKFIISNATMDPTIYPLVWGEQLEVPCNRHNVHGERPVIYSMLNSKGRKTKVVHWKTVSTPDLKSFRRWTMTGLIHSLDSRIIDLVMDSLDWGIDIHDAVICNPEDGMHVRLTYAEGMDSIYRDRLSILNDYFNSVGIKNTPKARKQWEDVKNLVVPVDEEFSCSIYAMK